MSYFYSFFFQHLILICICRLAKLGCTVMFGRVSGILAVSRGFGDIDFKAPHNQGVDFVSAVPYVNTIELTDNDEFLVVACDGLWDVLTYEEAVEFVASQRWNGRSPIQVINIRFLFFFDFINNTILSVF